MKRKIMHKVKGSPAVDGAGVHLVRVLGPGTVKDFDPILMLDSFDSSNPPDYTAGFPMHPHRGIETISYLSLGQMVHRDSLGHADTIGSGEVQWMTAGSGIMHEELLPESERLLGVQLWLNLPSKDKMVPSKYQSIKREEIPEIDVAGGKVRLLAGTFGEKTAFKSSYLPMDYYDIHLDKNGEITIPTEEDRSIMLFTLLGSIFVEEETVEEKTAAKLSAGTEVTIKASEEPAQVLFISSTSLEEPVAWGGPIVMNTKEELLQARADLENNTFIRH